MNTQEYDCAYCPLGGIGAPVIVAGHPAHPSCADAVAGESPDRLALIRHAVSMAVEAVRDA